MIKEALWYEQLSEKKIHCLLCPHDCVILPGAGGRCRVRKNQDGILIASNYGKAGGYALDPVEKKPLYHFYPRTQVLSVGARGCNLKCEFCQNWQLAHGDHDEVDITPLGLLNAAERYQAYYDVIGLAYTYSEPLMWYEFVLDACRLARQSGMKNVIVTNGYINQDPLQQLLPYVDAMNIDVKGFNNEFYEKVAHGTLEPVLKTAETAKKQGCHVEITTLLIPGMNDSPKEIRCLVEWIASALGGDTPLHFSRYFPNYKLRLDPTSMETLEQARKIALDKLDYVYLGNTGSGEYVNTFCPSCGFKVIARDSGRVDIRGLKGNTCAQCGKELDIIIGSD